MARILSEKTLQGLFTMQHYRFLTIPQFARIAGFSVYHAAEILRDLEGRNCLGYFGFVSIPGQGKTPKVYYLKRKGFELLRSESDFVEEAIGAFVEVSPELTWTPQMFHRLRLLDLLIALEVGVRGSPQIDLVRTFLEYRRVKGTHARETTDYVTAEEIQENRIVPDGAFILENVESGRRALFFLEMDMGTERIATKRSKDTRATLISKLQQYDRYLTSGRFASTYADCGQFRSCLILFVTYGKERIGNIKAAASALPPELHGYYRFADFPDAITNFLGAVWQTRSQMDRVVVPLVG